MNTNQGGFPLTLTIWKNILLMLMEKISKLTFGIQQDKNASLICIHRTIIGHTHACWCLTSRGKPHMQAPPGMWLNELRQYCEDIPVLCVANKIDIDKALPAKCSSFRSQTDDALTLSAAKGTNVVKAFEKAIQLAWTYKTEGNDMEELYRLLDTFDDFRRK